MFLTTLVARGASKGKLGGMEGVRQVAADAKGWMLRLTFRGFRNRASLRQPCGIKGGWEGVREKRLVNPPHAVGELTKHIS